MLGCTLITAALFLIIALAVYGAVISTDFIKLDWLESLAGFGGSLIVLVLGWFLFPAICTAIMGLFIENMASRIEQDNYPDLPQPRVITLAEQLKQLLSSLKRTLGLNLLCAPLYLIPGVNLLAYGLVNGKLLAREYFFSIAQRHLEPAEVAALYTAQKWPIYQRGLLISALFVLPGINLFAPVLATGIMTHFLCGAGGSLRARLAFAPLNVLPNEANGTT